MDIWAAILVIVFGVIGTTQLHLAKVMQKHGIEVFDNIRAKLRKEKKIIVDEGRIKKPVIYFIGLILNASETITLMLANLFGEYPALYTSMFGVGMVFSLLYSTKFLGEKVIQREIFGSIVIIMGTLVLGIEGIFRPDYNEEELGILESYIFILSFLGIGISLMAYSLKTKDPLKIGFFFAIVSGGFGGMDIIFKLLGQVDASGGVSIIPLDVTRFIVFLTSFGIAFTAFSLTQWAFARKAPARVFIPTYDSFYVALPIIYQAILLPGFLIWASTVIGFTLIVFGIVLMKAFKKETAISPIVTNLSKESQEEPVIQPIE